MSDIQIDPAILKAARLFVSKEATLYYLNEPWAQRIKGRSVIVASDGHTMFIANDVNGKNYPDKPLQVCARPIKDFTPVNWRSAVNLFAGRPKKPASVCFNPKYVERAARAARILGVTASAVSLSGPFDPATIHLGPNAMAVLMPMRAEGVPHLASWVSEVVAVPKKKHA